MFNLSIEKIENEFLHNKNYYWGTDEYAPNDFLPYPEVIGKVLSGYTYSFSCNLSYIENQITTLLGLKNSYYENYSWGIPFPLPGTDNLSSYVVTNAICLEGLYRAEKKLNLNFDEIFRSNFDWLYNVNGCSKYRGRFVFNYSPTLVNQHIINSNAKFLWILYAKEELLSNSEINIRDEVLNYIISQQFPNGAWYYSPEKRFIDLLHSCYVLEGLIKVKRCLTEELDFLDRTIKKGMTYILLKFVSKKDIINDYIYLSLDDIKSHNLDIVFLDFLRRIKHLNRFRPARLWSIAALIRVLVLYNKYIDPLPDIFLKRTLVFLKNYQQSIWYNYSLNDKRIFVRHQSHLYESLKMLQFYFPDFCS